MRFYLTLAVFLLFSPITAAQQSLEGHTSHAMPEASPAPAAPDVKLMLFPEQLPEAGKTIRVVAQLTKDGKPLEDEQLKVVHAEKFHLLLVNPALTDYQHIHPKPTATPGSYLFTFTPKSSQNYCAWADVTPVEGTQVFALSGMGSEMSKLATPETLSNETTIDGYRFVLTFDAPPKAGQASMGTVRVTDAAGQPVATLQPVMGAFAHIVAFLPNCQGVIHTHPMGEEPKDDSARGGPNLVFHLEPKQSGFLKIFAQVNIGGKEIFAPFGITVSP